MSSLEKNIFKQPKTGGKESLENQPIRSRAYRGFSTVGASKGSWTLYDFALIKQDLINHLHIRQGEKLSDPSFGTIIWDVLFEPLTPELKEQISADVSDVINFDPRIQAESIDIESFETGLQISAEITFLPYNISEFLRFRFDQENGFGFIQQ